MTTPGIEFYILSYNNTFCAKYQIKTLRKFCLDPFKITILDSNCGEHPQQSAALEGLCKTENIELIKMPNALSLPRIENSDRLGLKLNYIFNELVKERKPAYFAFLDQDMFMFRPFRIIHFLDKHGMWGDVDETVKHKSPTIYKKDIVEGPWYLHPWLAFFKFDFVKDEELDFRPYSCISKNDASDTGGANWLTFFSKHPELKKSDYWFRDNIKILFPFREVSNAGPEKYKDQYFNYNGKVIYGQIQINNDFIHMLNSPSDLFHPKVAFMAGFLENALNQ